MELRRENSNFLWHPENTLDDLEKKIAKSRWVKWHYWVTFLVT